MATSTLLGHFQKFNQYSLGTPFIVIVILSMMILPLPPFILDLLFTFNIALAMVIILTGIYVERPLDFAAFPTVILVATLLRLSLNVASTRVVLLNGHTGTNAAGQVVKSFGEVVVGGNYTVGLVVFAILVVINFVVVTKGAGRVSEVSARFTLDALPGKQMAIDADLNAGIIGQEEAKKRREEISREADFYGAMDGASKFVRGDAVAGILILFINLIGGVVIGMLQHDMSFVGAMHNYALLTIGDGLVAQVPALLLSTAAAIMVTRVSSAEQLNYQIVSQIFSNPKTLFITSIVIGTLGIIPGMPHIAFLFLAGFLGISGYYMEQYQHESARKQKISDSKKEIEKEQKEKDLDWEDVASLDIISLEVGYRLIPMVDEKQGGQLLGRIRGIRKKISQEFGFLIPSVHIKDNLDLNPNVYKINVAGVTFGEAEVVQDKLLAINPGQVFGEIQGIETKDPAFGLSAFWIEESLKDQAQTYGYTVVDTSTVIATHLSKILNEQSDKLLNYEIVQKLLDRLAQTSPKLVSELIPDLLPLGSVVKVMKVLLQEKVPIKDLRTIIETLAETASKNKDLNYLVSAVRVSLKRLIIQSILGNQSQLPVITFQPELEQILQNSIQNAPDKQGVIEPSLAEKIQAELKQVCEKQDNLGEPSILIVSPLIRTALASFLRVALSQLYVLSYQEIPEERQIKIVGTIG